MNFLDKVILNPSVQLKKGLAYPFIEMANVGSYKREPENVDTKVYSSGSRFTDGDTVIARITPCLQNGKGFYCHNIGEGFGSTEFIVLRPKDQTIDSRYLYYFMQTNYIRGKMIKSMVGASGRQRVNNDIFASIDISFPEIKIQHRIADILSAYDDLIENNQKQIKLLEEAAQRLYKEWFVDLRFPGYEHTKITDGVTEGWERASVGSLIGKVGRTKQIPTSEYLSEGKIPVIDQSREFIAGYTNDDQAIVKSEVPIIVFGDHTRILKLIQFPFAKGADGTQLIISASERMPQRLLYYSLINFDLSNYHYARHFKYLKSEIILLPSKGIADDFEKITDPIFKKIQSCRDLCCCGQEARDRLLPKLIN